MSVEVAVRIKPQANPSHPSHVKITEDNCIAVSRDAHRFNLQFLKKILLFYAGFYCRDIHQTTNKTQKPKKKKIKVIDF